MKMAPIDRSHTTYYWSAIVTNYRALSLTTFELSDVGVDNIVTLKDRLGGHIEGRILIRLPL